MEKLLIIEDTDEIRSQLKWGLSREYEILAAVDREQAETLFRKHLPRVVTLDLGLPPDEEGTEEGFRCLETILGAAPATKVIVITGNGDSAHALKAIATGAYDYYRKPVDLGELRVMLKRAFHLAAIEEQNRHLHAALGEKERPLAGIVGQSPRMQEVFATVRKVAPSDAAVLLTGESGTGKEVVARSIHGLSMRKGEPFIPINCGAIPENLLESELFGFEKGAFSGAHTRVQGKVEYAHRGTLFLDEIGELPPTLQVKLLRFLQEKVIQRVGGREDIPVDARIIAATNRDIVRATEEGGFREDLFYRIAVIHMDLPPLRERGGDIMLLANLFLAKFTEEFRKKVRGFSTAAMKEIESYEWPGNVRELENRVQRGVIMSDSPLLDPEDLGFNLRSALERSSGTTGMTLRDAREKVERHMILAAMESKRNNMAKAAEALGISRPTLYDLVRKYGLFKTTP